MIFDSHYIGYADYTQDDQASFLFWHAMHVSGYLFVGDTPKTLVSQLSLISGRMRPLPEWISNGIIVGLQGG
jgi:alpha-glucosidase (family GH31 glycosyl hydrolase)